MIVSKKKKQQIIIKDIFLSLPLTCLRKSIQEKLQKHNFVLRKLRENCLASGKRKFATLRNCKENYFPVFVKKTTKKLVL